MPRMQLALVIEMDNKWHFDHVKQNIEEEFPGWKIKFLDIVGRGDLPIDYFERFSSED